MEHKWIVKEDQNQDVVVIVLGWASDWKIVNHIRPENYDVVCIYNFIDTESKTPSEYAAMLNCEVAGIKNDLIKYSDKYLFAWSFGVWVSEIIFSDFTFDRSVALNGSSCPVDNSYGIEPRRMAITLRGIAQGGMDAFNRRTYGIYYDELANKLSPRSLDENIEELRTLVEFSACDRSETYNAREERFKWDKAIIGSHDAIFSPENLQRYWGVIGEILPLPHYPFYDSGIIISEIEGR